MKKRINFFDLGLLLLVVLLGLGAYFLSHEAQTLPPDSAEPLLTDIRRNSDHYADQAVLAEKENYNVQYRIALGQLEPDACAEMISVGDELLNTYVKSSMGTVISVGPAVVDGVTRTVITLEVYTVFTKTSVKTPFDCELRVGNDIGLSLADGTYLDTGTVLWISH